MVAIGMFDGVHLGHQRLIATAVQLAKRARAASVVVTFHPDPQHILDPTHAPRPIMLLEDRVRLISALGVDRVWVIPFTSAFSKRSAEQFVEDILVKQLHACGVVVGPTFSFGSQRRGTLQLLQELGRPHGMRVVIVAPVRRGGDVVSSSRIRRLIQSGELEEAHRLLGRPVELSGKVRRGVGRARRLGFPTA
ncbi:MAG: adenylyltransferase/cytidyltransferase family protein, partial [Candidatus Omnitrophica bacterium]|nr:adenylyltransferase/cytidyltransferase family protein [Candidatus Omnitrophota bacterium]